MCGRWRRALFVRKVVKVFYLDYGFADEDVMENQIKYPPIQAQKLVVIEDTRQVDIWKVEKVIICKKITGFIPQSLTWITVYEVTDEDVMEDQIYVLPETWITIPSVSTSRTCDERYVEGRSSQIQGVTRIFVMNRRSDVQSS